MISSEAAEQFLASTWLAEMDVESRRQILELLEERRADAGVILLHPGRPNDRIGFLIKGGVKVTMNGRSDRASEILTIEAPSMFGLTTFFRSAAPGFTVRASTPVWYLTLDRDQYERTREIAPRVAEQLALAAVHVLSDRIELLDHRIAQDLAEHPDDQQRVTEWSSFRSRLFEDSVL